jgi:hypothetical protein
MGLQERLLLVLCVPIDAVASAKLYRWALAVARRILYERAAHNSSTRVVDVILPYSYRAVRLSSLHDAIAAVCTH